MIENFRLSIWDYLVTFFVGLLFLLIVSMHYIFFTSISYSQFIELFQNISLSTTIILIPSIFVLGLIVDCIAIAIDDIFLGKRFRKIFSKVSQEVRENNKELDTWKKFVNKEYMSKKVQNKINPYFWCKYYLEQKDIATPEQVFTSKYGFYRVLSTVSLAHIIIMPLLYGISIWVICTMLIAFGLGFIFAWRSNRFYYHAGKAIYCNYIISKENKK